MSTGKEDDGSERRSEEQMGIGGYKVVLWGNTAMYSAVYIFLCLSRFRVENKKVGDKSRKAASLSEKIAEMEVDVAKKREK